MSAKKTKSRPSWIPTENGGGYTLQVSRHGSNNTSFGSDAHDDTRGPTISDGVLTAQVIKMKEKEVQIPGDIKDSIIELHPETMQLCEMRLGGPVLVTPASMNGTSKKAFRVWPSVAVSLGKAAMSEAQLKHLGFKEDEFVQIFDAESLCEVASEVTVKVMLGKDTDQDTRITKSASFRQYIQKSLEKKYCVIGQQIVIQYFGKMLHVLIISASSHGTSNNEVKDPHPNVFGDTDLEDSLVKLSLQGSADSEMYNGAGGSPCMKNDLSKDWTSTPKRSNSKSTKSSSDSIFQMVEGNSRMPRTPSVYQIVSSTTITVTETLGVDRTVPDENIEYFGTYTYDSIGGLQPQIKVLKELIELPILKPQLFKSSGLTPPTGILLYGPPGTGKSMLVKACVNEIGASAILLQGARILSRYFGDSEQKLRDLFVQARERAPCVIVVDEIDAVCPQRDSTRSDVEKRLVSSFITLLDGVTSANHTTSQYVVVLATTNRIDAIDPALRRAGRFDREIEIPIPSPDDRTQIFSKILSCMKHTLQTRDVELLAERAHGYVGADIAAVCKESGMKGLRRSIESSKEVEGDIGLCMSDFEFGLKQIPPSAMRELIVQVPKVLWSDIGGNAEVKKKLKQAVEWPLKNPDAFERLGIDPPRGVLLYGPPGCSKTLTAKALATESGLNFISIKGPELFSKYVGDSERAIRRVFSKARSAAPSIVFFDELDALAIERGGGSSKGGGNVADRVLAAMLTEMDGVEQRRDVIVVAATNRPDMIDKALLRPGRIDRIVHVPLPDSETRKDIFRIQFRKTPVAADVGLEWLVEKTEMYSGAEICAVCREAALAALDDNMEADQLTTRDFERALDAVRPQTTKASVKMYEDYSKTLQSSIKR